MSTTFLNLMSEIFPDISPETQSKLHRLIKDKNSYPNWLFSHNIPENLCQGDVIKLVPTLAVGKSGKPIRKLLPAILLNNSCDMVVDDNKPRSEFTTIIPLLPFNEYISFFRNIPNYTKELKQNVITDKFYIGGLPGEESEFIADLGMLSSLSTEYLHFEITNGSLKKIASFSQNGYYYFLAKLTLHLMRPESKDIKREELLRKKRSIFDKLLNIFK